MKKALNALVIMLLVATASCIFDIDHFGAVVNSDTVNDQFKNQHAILQAIKAANSSSG